MKRIDLVKKLEKGGVYLDRHGSRHDIYFSPITNRPVPVPRHKEIKEPTAQQIMRDAGIE